MSDEQQYQKWTVSDSDLMDMNPIKARDLITQCFYEAQRETLFRAKKKLGSPSDDLNIMKSIEQIIKATFNGVGEDFQQPDKQGLMKVIESLAKKSSAVGTPLEIIEYHKGQIMKILNLL
ncbi:hypothetical protein KAR10_09700 [bacterium]|nr:hypothetical protein [bacterium]